MLRSRLSIALLVSITLGVAGCPCSSGPGPLVLPPAPAPLSAANSPYDDYNAAAPDVAGGRLVFSTNRFSSGAHFDLALTQVGFEEDRVEVDPVVAFEPAAMSEADELGPEIERDTLVFTSDRPGGAGSHDLYRWTVGESGSSPSPLEGVNTERYEGYWTRDTTSEDRAIFASDRGDRGLDAYEVTPAYGGPSAEVRRIDELSTDANETAFHYYTHGAWDFVLFASDRPGGQGDYDLYCSRQNDDGTWTAPRPLAYANSPQRDFRPVIVEGWHRDVLVFSSDRPGGQGGMDLYYTAFRNVCDD